MTEFFPTPGLIIDINNTSYEVSPHPEALGMAYGLEQGEATVYQLKKVNSKSLYALKIFRPSFRGDFFVKKTEELKKFAKLDGLTVCNRICLSGTDYPLIKQYPELEYSILMPWIAGDTWSNIIQKKIKFNKSHSLTFATIFSKIMQNLEKKHLAHCDISDGNVIFDTKGGRYIELIDIEHLYYPNSEKPTNIPAGSDGYAHREASRGLWSESSDRFALAILLAEIICWHNPDFRNSVGEDSVFPQRCIHTICDQYNLAKKILGSMSKELYFLFEKAWASDYLLECPTASDWVVAIDNITNPSPVRGWKSLNIESVGRNTPKKIIAIEETKSDFHQSSPEIYYTKDQDGYSNGMLRWLSKSTEYLFELSISTDKDFKKIIRNLVLTEKEFTFNEASGVYYCRVRSTSTDATGDWSKVLKVSISEK